MLNGATVGALTGGAGEGQARHGRHGIPTRARSSPRERSVAADRADAMSGTDTDLCGMRLSASGAAAGDPSEERPGHILFVPRHAMPGVFSSERCESRRVRVRWSPLTSACGAGRRWRLWCERRTWMQQ
eukprot:3894528-Rhodomonas_salina.8